MTEDEIAPIEITPPLKNKNKDPWWYGVVDLGKFALIALIIVVPIRIFIAQPFVVSGDSMDTTFANGQYLIVDEISYRFHEPARGDVIVFHFPLDQSKFFIKRIIGLPGDTLKLSGKTITVINKANPNGFVLHEPYVQTQADMNETVTLPAGQYFVMGDNRTESYDSRSWGNVPRNLIVGRAYMRLFPINEVGILPGAYKEPN